MSQAHEQDLSDFAALVDALPQSHVYISHVDQDCKFTRYYNVSPSLGIIGRVAEEIASSDPGQKKLTAIRREVIRTGIPQNFEIQLRHPVAIPMPVDDKHPLSAFQACVVPRKSQDGKIVGATTILTDVSPRKQAQEQVVSLNQQLEQQLQDMQKSKEEAEKSREQAQKAEESVTNFLANMSHELRTPLNTILATVELLAISKPALSAEQVELINLIDRHGHDLLRLLNGILDFSKMEAGKMVIRSQPFDLHQLLYDLRDLMSPAMVTNNNSFCLSLHPDVPRFVEGDRQAIYRVILNLLSNACKFTEKGQVSLRVVLDGAKRHQNGYTCCNIEHPEIIRADCEANKSMIEEKIICFEVRDTGIGIEEKHLHRLFERFSQVDSSTKREYGGTGLGLAICKGLVEKMKGCISVTSNKDEGSVFLFKLPLKEAPIIISSNNPQASVPEDAVKAEMRFQTAGSSVALPRLSAESKMSFDPEHPPSFPTCKVLLVDDNDINRKVLNKMLAKFTCSVTDAVNGSNAVELYTSNPSAFNVVLMDLHMPGLDGYEATHAIREWEKKEKRAPVYITALTADVISGTDEKCIKAGMNDFVSKPVSMAVLARILRNAEKSMVVTVMDEKDKSSKTV